MGLQSRVSQVNLLGFLYQLPNEYGAIHHVSSCFSHMLLSCTSSFLDFTIKGSHWSFLYVELPVLGSQPLPPNLHRDLTCQMSYRSCIYKYIYIYLFKFPLVLSLETQLCANSLYDCLIIAIFYICRQIWYMNYYAHQQSMSLFFSFL